MIGIIAAMDSEVQGIQKAMEYGVEIQRSGMTFIKGKLRGKDVVAVKSGIGKVNAAMCAQTLINIFDVRAIIHVGVAGAIHPDLEIGDIVISKDSCQYDMDASAFGHPKGEIPELGLTYFKANEDLIALAEKAAKSLAVSYRVGRILTADQVVSSKELADELLEAFEGLCVEMEGGAVGHVATLNQVPHIIIRSMSDKADDNSDEAYTENLERSAQNGVDIVLKMIPDVL